jgi:endogenous inhibitor of DNA gyrase (YacG/DUF329 family)
MNSRLCPICEQPIVITAGEALRDYCSAACTAQAAQQLEAWQYVIQLRPLSVTEFADMLTQTALRPYARHMLWQQGTLEFMVCEDYTLADVHSVQVQLTPDLPIEPITAPSAAWREVLYDYALIVLPPERHIAPQLIAQLTNPWLLGRLAASNELWLCLLVARNPYTPAAALAALTERSLSSSEHTVRETFGNIFSPLRRSVISRVDAHEPLREALAQHRNLPAAALAQLATVNEPFTRRGVAANPNTDHATLVQLAEDPNRLVQKVARQRLTHI